MKMAIVMSALFLMMNNEIISLCVVCGWVFFAIAVLFQKAGEHGY